MDKNKREKRKSTATEAEEEAGEFSKRPKVPALASVIVEALKLDGLHRLSSSLEPLLRRIVSEEVERALAKLGQPKLTGRSSPQRIEGQKGRKLQLHFRSRLPPHLFTGAKVEGDQGTSIHIILLDAVTNTVVSSGSEAAAKLSVVVLEGNFNDENDSEWTQEHFESFEVKEREGKRPLLTGDLQVTLKEGVGTLGDLSFTDNSSWIRSRKFRLGVKVADGLSEDIHIREAKSEAFAVKDHRGELYKKHYPPVLHDEVWRLDRIAKDGALHKKLVGASIVTVEDFLRLFVRDQQKLRSILGSGMSNRMWDNTVEHAKTCVLSGKLYVYYSDETHSTGAVFNHIYELRGIISNGQYLSLESISTDQKISVDLLVKRAYDNWNRVVVYDGQALLNPPITEVNSQANQYLMPSMYKNNGSQSNPSPEPVLGDYFSEDEIRMRGTEILQHDEMQHMLRSFTSGMSVSGGFSTCGDDCYSYNVSPFEVGHERSQGSTKAVVSWIKLKAAFRWGIFVRKRAAERRAQLVELD